MKNRIEADLGTLRAIAASLRISENKVHESALLLVNVDHVSATSVRKRCAAEVKVLADVQTELHRKVREFEQANGMYRAHTKLVRVSYRIPNPIDAAKKVAEGMAKAVLAEILKTINKAKDKYKKYEYIAKLAKKGVFYGNYAGAGNKQANCEPALEGDDAFAVDKIVLDRYLPGGAKETITWSFIHNPVDPLDKCAAMHDARYGKLGIGATSQFGVVGLAKAAATNLQMAKCAATVGSDPAYDPRRTDPTGVIASDAAEGIVGLFGLMGSVGSSLATLAHSIAKVTPLSFDEALAIVNTTIGGSVTKAIKGVKSIDLTLT